MSAPNLVTRKTPAGCRAAGLNMETINMKRRNNKTRSSVWINARYSGRCHCGKTIKVGDRALYFPGSKKLSCRQCGRVDALRVCNDDLIAMLKARASLERI